MKTHAVATDDMTNWPEWSEKDMGQEKGIDSPEPSGYTDEKVWRMLQSRFAWEQDRPFGDVL
jgi:hypothetical protein